MENSILNSIKLMLGVEPSYTQFDEAIIMQINSAFSFLTELAAGPKEGFQITGSAEQWSDYIADMKQFNDVKTYIFCKVKLAWDPPSSSAIIENYRQLASECEFRITVLADKG